MNKTKEMKSDLMIECVKSIVDVYNLTQEIVGSKDRMEYPILKEEKKPREWWIAIDAEDCFYGLHTAKEGADEEKQFMKNSPSHKKPIKVIKLREVIE